MELTLFGAPYSLEGEASFEVDAWGSMVLPDGAVHDEVLQGDYRRTYQSPMMVTVGASSGCMLRVDLMLVFLHEELTVTSLDEVLLSSRM